MSYIQPPYCVWCRAYFRMSCNSFRLYSHVRLYKCVVMCISLILFMLLHLLCPIWCKCATVCTMQSRPILCLTNQLDVYVNKAYCPIEDVNTTRKCSKQPWYNVPDMIKWNVLFFVKGIVICILSNVLPVNTLTSSLFCHPPSSLFFIPLFPFISLNNNER